MRNVHKLQYLSHHLHKGYLLKSAYLPAANIKASGIATEGIEGSRDGSAKPAQFQESSIADDKDSFLGRYSAGLRTI